MSYSISVSGTKEEVKRKIDEQVRPYHPAAADALFKLIDEDLKGTHVHGSVSGADSYASWSLSASTQQP